MVKHAPKSSAPGNAPQTKAKLLSPKEKSKLRSLFKAQGISKPQLADSLTSVRRDPLPTWTRDVSEHPAGKAAAKKQKTAKRKPVSEKIVDNQQAPASQLPDGEDSQKELAKQQPKSKPRPAISESAQNGKNIAAKKSGSKKTEADSVVKPQPTQQQPPKLKRLSTASSATLNSRNLIGALRKKFSPISGGFHVETIASAVESPDSFALVPASQISKAGAKRRRTQNGFVVEDVDENGQEVEEEDEEELEAEEDEECDDSSCDCHSFYGDGSVGSDAEEMSSQEDGDDWMDWSDSEETAESEESTDSDESCPELIPIGAELSESSESSSSSNSESSSVDYEWTDASNMVYSDEDSDVYHPDDVDDYQSDPQFLLTTREPIVVTVGHGPNTEFRPFPLAICEQPDEFNAHETSVQSILQSAGRSRQLRLEQQRRAEAERQELEVVEEGGETETAKRSDSQPMECGRTKLTDRMEGIEPSSSTARNDSAAIADTQSQFSPIDIANDDSSSPPLPLTNPVSDDAPHDIFPTADYATGDDFDLNTADFISTAANKPRFYNSLNSRHCLLLLKAELHFHGCLRVRLLAGNVRCYGYLLRPNQPVRAFSPRGQAFLCLRPLPATGSVHPEDADPAHNNPPPQLDAIKQLLLSLQSDFINSDIYEAIELFDPSAGDALLLLEAADRETPAFRMLDKYMRQSIYPNINSLNVHRPFYSSEYILRTQFYTRPKTRLTINRQWLPVAAIAGQQRNSRVLVLGGKGVGKSTCVRWLVNQAIQRHGACVLIDLDIGQPELWVPECMAATEVRQPLLGAGYMLAQPPDIAMFYGELNVTVMPDKYLRCALQLAQRCEQRRDWADLPWVVNTMGYPRGLGLKLMQMLLRTLVWCTDVVQIEAARRLDNYEAVLAAEVVNAQDYSFWGEVGAWSGTGQEGVALQPAGYRRHVVRSMARRFGEKTADWDMSARDTRMVTVLAHLGRMLADGSEWVTDVRPVCAPIDNFYVTVSNETIAPEFWLHLVNANMVYLCYSDPEQRDVHNIECLGIGIVRGVEQRTRMIFLLPAMDRGLLKGINCLAIGNAPLPTSLILNHNSRVKGPLPFVYKTDSFIGSKQVVRIAYRPDGTPRKKE